MKLILLFIFLKSIKSIKNIDYFTSNNDEFHLQEKKSPIKKIFDETLSITKDLCPPKPKRNYHDINDDNYVIDKYQLVYACYINSVQHINANECPILIYKCTFQSLMTSNNGGAIYLYLSNEKDILEKINLIEKCSFKHCKAKNGGSIYISALYSSFIIDIVDNSFQENQASQYGGSIYFGSNHGTISYCHFINNACQNNEGSDITFELSISGLTSNTILNVHDNTFEHFLDDDLSKSMLYFINKKQVNFIFSENAINITKANPNFHIFDCLNPNLQFNDYDQFNGNCIISPLEKDKMIKGKNFNYDFTFPFLDTCITGLPKDPIDYIVYDYSKLRSNTRCKYVSNEEKNINVLVLVSNFTGFIQRNEDGGAIHINSCGLCINNSYFKNCVSNIGGGGAIYFRNSIIIYQNDLILSNVRFIGCKSVYGGALYVYSISKESDVSIQFCYFSDNEILQRESVNIYNLYGGSSIFLTSRIGIISNCTFNNNIGEGGSFKIYGVFEKNSNEKLFIIPYDENEEIRPIMIINCSFKDEDKSKNSIYFVNKNKGSRVEIINCSFNGTLNDGYFYIDGSLLDKNASKIYIKTCIFEDDTKITGNANIIDKFWYINVEEKLKNLLKKFIIVIIITELFILITFSILGKYEPKFKITF